MVKYCCEFCEYSTDRKQSLLTHLRREEPCSHKNNKDYVYLKNLGLYLCRLCDYETDTYCNISKHLYRSCEIMKKKKKQLELENKKREISNIQLEISSKAKDFAEITKKLSNKQEELTKLVMTDSNNGNISANTNINGDHNINNTTNNITNIIIVDYGKEDSSKLTQKEEKYILEKCYQAIIACAEKMHFNSRIPEQKNVYISNLRSNNGYKYINGKFMATNLKTLLLDIIRNRADNVRDILDRIKSFGFSVSKNHHNL